MKFIKLKKLMMASLSVVLALSLTACGKGTGKNQVIAGITGPTVTVSNGDVITSIVFNNISVDGGATFPIPKYPNSSLEVGPDFQSNGTLLVLTLSIADFLGNNVNLLNPQMLPGGRPLPTVASGALPSIALQIPKLFNTVLYLGPQVIGFFVPFKQLNLAGAILSFRFYNTSGGNVGTLSLVGSDSNGANAGILLLLDTKLLGIPGAAPAA